MRPIQQMFTFLRECQDKFGLQTGTQLWEAFNQVFDCMPLCAIVDEQIFTAHGGIPASVNRVEALYSIPVPLPNPNGINKAAWEMLWNDPVSTADYKLFMGSGDPSPFPDYPAGCCPNLKRGTAFYYSGKQ